MQDTSDSNGPIEVPTRDDDAASRETGRNRRGAPRFRSIGELEEPQAPSPREYLSDEEWRRRREPEAADRIVERLVAKLAGGRVAPAAALGAIWEDIVGSDFATRSVPATCEKGRLTVLVRDGATASRMRFITTQILQNAAAVVGEGQVTTVAFRVKRSGGR